MPRHLKYTIFSQRDEKLQKLHELEFPKVFFAFDEIKERANRLFKRQKFREAVNHYSQAYGLMKWLEFKEKKRNSEILSKPSMDPILDSEILIKQCYLDDIKVEKDSFDACLVYLLSNLGYAYMELKHFEDALDCFNEAIEIAGENKVADLFFRRSQARVCNKFSNDLDLIKGRKDAIEAFRLNCKEVIYKEHLDFVEKILSEREKGKYEVAESNFFFNYLNFFNCLISFRNPFESIKLL